MKQVLKNTSTRIAALVLDARLLNAMRNLIHKCNSSKIAVISGLILLMMLGTSCPVVETGPGIALTIRADPTQASEGDTVTYTYRVRNTGSEIFDSVNVTDELVGSPQYQSGDGNNNDILDTNETWIFSNPTFV